MTRSCYLYSPAVLEVRCGNPLSWHLATLHGIILNWTDFSFETLIRGRWGRLRFLSPWPLPLQTLLRENICCHVGLSHRKRIWVTLLLCTRRWTKETEGPIWWDHKSVNRFFSLSLRGFLSHLRNVQVFCLASRETAKLRAGGGETSFPPTRHCKNTGCSPGWLQPGSELWLRMTSAWSGRVREAYLLIPISDSHRLGCPVDTVYL